jgi:hypothetical protein
MQRLCKAFVLVALFLSVLPSAVFAGPPERWDFQIQRPSTHDIDIWRGETIEFTPRFLSYSVPWQFTTGATVTLYWSTNRWATAPWATNGVVLSDTGRVSVTWSPACDAGANSYNYFIGVSETNGLLCRVTGNIRMHGSPSFAPSTAPLPVWDGWTNNYIYAPYAALLSTSNALALSLQAEASRAQQAEAAVAATAQAAQSTASDARSAVGIMEVQVAQSFYYFQGDYIARDGAERAALGSSGIIWRVAWQQAAGASADVVRVALSSGMAALTNSVQTAQATADAAQSNAAFAATNSVDPVARASAASKPSYSTATNIATAVVSAYAAPSFPVYDYGMRTNVVFVLSNSVLYLYER